MSKSKQKLRNNINVVPTLVADDTDIDSSDYHDKLAKHKLVRYQSDTRDRKWLAVWTTLIVSVWLLSILIILVLNDLVWSLDNTVLVALLGTTTLNVLGLSFIVLRGHFKGEPPSVLNSD